MVHFLFQYLQDDRIVINTIAMRSSAGISHSLSTHFSNHGKYSGTRTVRLFRVLLVFYHSCNVEGNIFMYGSSLLYKFLWCPVANIAVGGGQVFIKGCVMIFTHVTLM